MVKVKGKRPACYRSIKNPGKHRNYLIGGIEMEGTKNFNKYIGNPILGNSTLGTCFDVYVTKENGRYRMDFSWRKKQALAVTFSEDGIHWEEPQITLPCNPESGWEDRVNRNCVLKIDGVYKMWYTGQARGFSYIGYAESEDGISFKRIQDEPIMISEYPWEGFSVMNPCVLYEDGRYRMWYSAGETFEPNVLGYAESTDGINWNKAKINPIMTASPQNVFERNRIGGCQVIKTDDMGYVIFYIGYRDINTACVCAARSKNGITGWERCAINPLVSPDEGSWDGEACYKPSAVWESELGCWRIWYNGRSGKDEYIGMAECAERNFFG